MDNNELETLKETIQRLDNKKQAWLPITIMVAQVVLTIGGGVLVAWAKNVNSELIHLQQKSAAFEAWMNVGPRFTTSDARLLKMETVAEATDKVGVQIGELKGQLHVITANLQSVSERLVRIEAQGKEHK